MNENLNGFDGLERIVARLRAPDGCPWDREQTHASLKRYLLEECYEVLEALDEGDTQKLCEELGDLLLQIALHTQIATEAGEFQMSDVLRSINTKLIRRHPHVFGDVKVADAREVEHNWEAIKREERQEDASLLAGVAKEMPALAYSQAIQGRAAQAGFDWESIEGILQKVAEELEELKGAKSKEEETSEFGDVLLALVNIARWLRIEAEEALRLANRRFYRRFTHMEEACRARGTTFDSLSFDEQNSLWEEAKRQVG